MQSLFILGKFDTVEFFLTLFTGTASPFLSLLECLFMAGCWKMFEKSGVRGWWSLIPCAREYKLAQCAGRESEGRTLSALEFVQRVFAVFGSGPLLALHGNGLDIGTAVIFVDILLMVIGITAMVYRIRVYAGLTEVYGVKKRWIIFLLLGLKFVPVLAWGFGKKYQPEWKVEDIRAELARLASHGKASVMDEGLSVNLQERSTLEFFHKKILLRDIHMSIPQGHMVLLLGGSGAGKTTYVNAVNGYEKAKAEVLLNGTNMYKQYRKMQYEVGFVPQYGMMREKDTVEATMLDAAKLRLPRDVSAQQRRKRVDEVLDIFGLTPSKTHLVEKLSGGQKRRLSIAMEFISNPSLFILDEPDSGLDGVMARELFVQLRKIADTGKIVIVITHTPDRVIDLFDDVIVLAKDSARTGRLAFYGSVEEARKFFGRKEMEQIVKCINPKAVGGDGRADEFVMKYAEVSNG